MIIRSKSGFARAISELRRLGVRFLKDGRISIAAPKYQAGMVTGVQRQKFDCFAKALRSRFHATGSILRWAKMGDRLVLAFTKFQAWLMANALNDAKNVEVSLGRLEEFASAFRGIRTEKQVKVRDGLATIEDLIIFLHNRTASVAKLRSILPLIPAEKIRRLGQIYKMQRQARFLWLVWNFEMRRTEWIAKKVEYLYNESIRISQTFNSLYHREPDCAALRRLIHNLRKILLQMDPPICFQGMAIKGALLKAKRLLDAGVCDAKAVHAFAEANKRVIRYLAALHHEESEESRPFKEFAA